MTWRSPFLGNPALLAPLTISRLGAEGGAPRGETGGAGGHDANGSGGLGGEGNNGSGASSSGGSATGGSASPRGSGGAASGGAGSGGAANQLTTATKLDLLFVIDNSISMGDKQALLSHAVPGLLLEGLVHPPCLNGAGASTPSTNGTCPTGDEPAHAPLDDVHIGVITSSLGAHAGVQCAAANTAVTHPNDMARLLATVRPALDAQPDFLTFSGGSLAETTELLQAQVVAAEDQGCGYEAPLEAMYRFLVDPSPPLQVIRDGGGTGQSKRDGLDTTLLAQRAAFLRPDSAVVVLLTDENDCSIIDTGSGWAISSPEFDFTAGSEVCDTNPNDACCYSCMFAEPAGCEASLRCATAAALPKSSDRATVRCFEQKRRFGFSLLYPTKRYVDALTLPQIKVPDCWGDSCSEVENPLFPLVGDKRRSPGMVLLLGIVGVPWQDLATAQVLE